MPSVLDITSASAGDMFMGALIPGLILVGLYMLYILVVALLKPKTAPPVPYDGTYDRTFALRIALSLVPPLTLIFAVLGSIILGIATVNQAGAIGAIGAIVMASYRLTTGKRHQYTPMIMAAGAIAIVAVLLQFFELNIKNISNSWEMTGILLATAAVVMMTVGILWAVWRTYKIDNTLVSVMVDTAKTTSMVFIILIGATMLTSAFRAFGGEELVKHFLTGLPGGFWTQFLVVMLVIFLLGFFLDFIEIAVVVVPIVAPILLSDPSANITAVWFGVMVGLNIQTSFLTPPFGFALFYLRGVAPPEVKTTHIYKGAVAFICLQLLGLAVAGYFPTLVNYMPNRTYLTADTAPPPVNPRLQLCIEEDLFPYYANHQQALLDAIDKARSQDYSALPDDLQSDMQHGFDAAESVFEQVRIAESAAAALAQFSDEFRPLHQQARRAQRNLRRLEIALDDYRKELDRLQRWESPLSGEVTLLEETIRKLEADIAQSHADIPDAWDEQYQEYQKLAKSDKIARGQYRRTVDEAYEPLATLRTLLLGIDSLEAASSVLDGVDRVILNEPAETAIEQIKARESLLSEVDGTSHIKSALSRSRRALKGDRPNQEKALTELQMAQDLYQQELLWRQSTVATLQTPLNAYHQSIRTNIGLRLQPQLPRDLAKSVASCLSHHRDISLHF